MPTRNTLGWNIRMINIDPNLWGPPAWKLLHDVSFYVSTSTDQNIVKKATAFYNTLHHVLPCIKCQYSYDLHRLHLQSPVKQEEFPRWVFDLHNRVNDTLPKKKTHHPIWTEWKKEYPIQMKQHRLRDIWPFVQSVVEVHPGSHAHGLHVYPSQLKIFFQYLWEFLYKMNAYHEDKPVIKEAFETTSLYFEKNTSSKRDLRDWITSIGKTIHSSIPKGSCTQACHV